MHTHTLIQTQREHCAESVLCFHVQKVELVPVPKSSEVGEPAAVYKGPEPSPDVQKARDWEAWGPQDKVSVTKSPSILQTTGLPGPRVCIAFTPTS